MIYHLGPNSNVLKAKVWTSLDFQNELITKSLSQCWQKNCKKKKRLYPRFIN
jgi:hypothetical protein